MPSYTVYCNYRRVPGRLDFEAADDGDRTRIIKCRRCGNLFDAFSWLEMADLLEGRRLKRPVNVQFTPSA